jgi:hypothetical protein
MQAFIDRHGGKALIAIVLLGLMPFMGACTATRQIRPNTAESRLDSLALALSIAPQVSVDTIISTVPGRPGVRDTVVVKRSHPVDPLSVIARRDTSSVEEFEDGRSVRKTVKTSTRNSTAAEGDLELKEYELKKRTKADVENSKNKWPCILSCGGASAGYSSYDSYLYSGSSYFGGVQYGNPVNCNPYAVGGCVYDFGASYRGQAGSFTGTNVEYNSRWGTRPSGRR